MIASVHVQSHSGGSERARLTPSDAGPVLQTPLCAREEDGGFIAMKQNDRSDHCL